MALEDLALEHYRRQQGIARQTSARLMTLWDYLGPQGFRDRAGDAAQVVAAGQFAAAAQSGVYLEAAAAEQGVSTSAAAAPRAFSGLTAAGNALDVVLSLPTGRMFQQIDAGRDPSEAYLAARARVALVGANETTQAGTNALGVGLSAADDLPQYVRLLTRPSCRRCVILAGRKYYAAEPFRRHPQCDCVHVPVTDSAAADRLRTNPDAYFESLTEAEQNRVFGKKKAQAIRDGADIVKVVNRAERGPGVLRRFRTPGGDYVRVRRMTVEQIYDKAAGDRDALVRLFTEQGYLKPGRTTVTPLGSRPVGLVPSVADDVVEAVETVADEASGLAALADEAAEALKGGSWTSTKVPTMNPKGTIRTGESIVPDAAGYARLDRIIDVGEKVDDEVQRRLAARLAALKAEAVEPPKALVDGFEKATAKRARAHAAMNEAYDKAFSEAEAKFFARALPDAPPGLSIDTFKKIMGRSMTDSERAAWERAVAWVKYDGDYRAKVKAAQAAVRAQERAKVALDRATGADLTVGSPRWNQALRESIIEVLDEVHAGSGGVGGSVRPTWVKAGTRPYMAKARQAASELTDKSELKRAMDFAVEGFPASWNARARAWAAKDGGDGRVALHSVKRGFNRLGVEIALSKDVSRAGLPDDVNGYLRVAVHEYGHSMESAVDDLAAAQWAFLSRRAQRAAPEGQSIELTSSIYGGTKEYGYRDDFTDRYSGKVYGRLSPESGNFELFTTGVEALLGGRYNAYMRTKSKVDDDVEFRRFILGVLSVLGR